MIVRIQHNRLSGLSLNKDAYAQTRNAADADSYLGVTRKTLPMLLNGHRGISAEMALRLGKAFGTTPEFWLNMQCNYDLWNAGQQTFANQDILKVRR